MLLLSSLLSESMKSAEIGSKRVKGVGRSQLTYLPPCHKFQSLEVQIFSACHCHPSTLEYQHPWYLAEANHQITEHPNPAPGHSTRHRPRTEAVPTRAICIVPPSPSGPRDTVLTSKNTSSNRMTQNTSDRRGILCTHWSAKCYPTLEPSVGVLGTLGDACTAGIPPRLCG